MLGNIPTKTLKQSGKSFSDTLQKLFKRNGHFSENLKSADVTTVF